MHFCIKSRARGFHATAPMQSSHFDLKLTVRAADGPEYERAELRAVPVLGTVVVMVMVVVVVVSVQVLGYHSVALAVFVSNAS